MKTYTCQSCGGEFDAREADRKRGWARFCSKSCKAVKQGPRTGNLRSWNLLGENETYNADMDGAEDAGWDSHKDWL
jgi:hypothetical protein